MGVKYIDEPDTEFKVIFSDWSPETSIGKNATQQVLVKPTSLEAPVLSDFSFSVTQENELNLTCGKYYIDVPTSIFDALLYCEAAENMFEPMYIETQMKINNNEWEDVYIANPNWIFSNYRIASPDGTALNENDSVKVRARFVCENLGLYSDWSNIIGTKASFKASTWAQYELLDARILGLIPDKLLNEDLTLPINRAEFADISVKTYEILSGTTVEPAENNPFTDTNDAEILKAYNAGITVGTSATTFSPDKLINREQAATMLARVYKKIAINGWEINKDSDFEDLFVNLYTMPSLFSDDDKISDWAKSSVYFMAANKIINGIGSNTFAPKATTEEELRSGYAQATREQAIIMASKMIKNLNFSTSLLEKTTL